MKTYTVLEASETLSISTRAVQKRCKKHDVRKKDNKFLIKQNDIDQWRKEIESRVPKKEFANVRNNELEAEVESLKKELAELKKFKENVLRNQKAANIKDDLFHENIEKEFNINKNQQNKL